MGTASQSGVGAPQALLVPAAWPPRPSSWLALPRPAAHSGPSPRRSPRRWSRKSAPSTPMAGGAARRQPARRGAGPGPRRMLRPLVQPPPPRGCRQASRGLPPPTVETLESEQPRDYAAGESKPSPNTIMALPGSGFPSNWRWLPKPDRESIGCAGGAARRQPGDAQGSVEQLAFSGHSLPRHQGGRNTRVAAAPGGGQRQNPPGRRGRHLRLRSLGGATSRLRGPLRSRAPLESPAGPFARPSIPS